jgi:hypothetical protein
MPQLTTAEVAGGAGTLPGWFYDTSPDVITTCGANFPPGQRISFLNHMPPTGSEVRLSCNQNVLGGSDATAQIGTFCIPGPETPGMATMDGSGNVINACPGALVPSRTAGNYLTCDSVTRACGVDCVTDADCREAGLLGFVCDPRNINDVTGNPADPATPYLFCVNPTCN